MTCYVINGIASALLFKVDSQVIDREASISDDILQHLKDFGLFGLQIPQEYGMYCFVYFSDLAALDDIWLRA